MQGFHLHSQDVIKPSFWQPSKEINRNRTAAVAMGMSAAYAGGMSILYSTWYRDYEQSGFHSFDDSKEWNQMDKLGHTGSSYYLGRWSGNLLKWAGTDPKKAAWIGAGAGFVFQFTIEMLDAYSAKWGYSHSDVIANTAGSLLYLTQELGWKEQRITFKISYSESGLARYRPDALGSSLPERILKDYNGQTYWLSANLNSFFPKSSFFPVWLNLAAGYGADGMLGAISNTGAARYTDRDQDFKRIRQFYIAPDIDLTKIESGSGLINALQEVFGFIKFPAPAVELNSNGKVIFHPVFF